MKDKTMRRGHKVTICSNNKNIDYHIERFTPITTKSQAGISYIKYISNNRRKPL